MKNPQHATLVSILKSVDVPSVSRYAKQPEPIAAILTAPVFDALRGRGLIEDTQLPPTPELDPWEPALTLLALASRESERPLQAWATCLVKDKHIAKNELDEFVDGLRQRFGPDGTQKNAFRLAMASPVTFFETFATATTDQPKTILSPTRLTVVCNQCRKDHQRCDRKAERPCKRCTEHGWFCPPPSPSKGAKRAAERALEQQARKRRREAEEEEDDEEPFTTPAETPAPIIKPVSTPAEKPCAHCLEAETLCEIEQDHLICTRCTSDQLDCSFGHPSPPPLRHRSRSMSSRVRSQRSRSRASSREVSNLGYHIEPSHQNAIDEALVNMGLRRTPANIAFLTEAGLIPSTVEYNAKHGVVGDMEEGGSRPRHQRRGSKRRMSQSSADLMAIDVPEISRRIKQEQLDTMIEDDEDVASVDASVASDFSFFADTTAGTPATVHDPHHTDRDKSLDPNRRPSTGSTDHAESSKAVNTLDSVPEDA